VNGLIESAGESTEDYDIMLHLRYCSAEVSGVWVGSACPVRLGFKVGEAGDAFHEVGRVLVPVLNDGDALRT